MRALLEQENAMLKLEINRLRGENETLQLKLAACGVAAMCNTHESKNKELIRKDNPYWSASYGDVCDAVDREISLREKLAVALEHWAMGIDIVFGEDHDEECDAEWKLYREIRGKDA